MMEKHITSQDIANYFISLSNDTENLITNLKLQKLVYYTQAWFLGVHSSPIFEDDFEAWVHGPVLRSLYDQYKQFGWRPIDVELKPSDELLVAMPDKVQDIIKDIVEEYFGLTAYQLERLTHSEDPWLKAREGAESGERSNKIISKESMQTYYGHLVSA